MKKAEFRWDRGAAFADIKPHLFEWLIEPPHARYSSRNDDRHQSSFVIRDVRRRPFTYDNVSLGFVQKFTIGTVRLRISTSKTPVAEMLAVLGVVAVGLNHHRSGAVRKSDGFLHHHVVAYDPRREHQATDDSSDRVSENAFLPWKRCLP